MAGNKEDQEQRFFSLRLYDVLEMVGASEKMRNLHKRASTTSDILATVYHTLTGRGSAKHVYMCGSSYEGSVTPDLSADIDNIMCMVSVPVELNYYASPSPFSLLTVSDAWTYPGYVKLQVMNYGIPLTSNDGLQNWHVDHDEVGRTCIRHFTHDEDDGPAAKTLDENGVHVRDHVGAVKCKTLPLFARHQLDRFRRRGLISDEEFDKLNNMGCMFVGAGYFMSHEKNLEWRLSLSLQERRLMSKLNPTQHKVYILLKMIKRNIIEKVVDSDVFTSYHCKTCVLYTVLMTPVRSWTPDNIIKCLIQCIKLLKLWLKNNFCPNVFNGDQNLFSKNGFSDIRRSLLHTLDNIIKSNNQSNNHFLTLIQTDHVGHILLEGERRWVHTLDLEISKLRCKITFQPLMYTCIASNVVLHGLCGKQYSHFSLISAVDILQQTETITEHTPAETQEALDYFKPWFHLHIAKCLACLSYRCQYRSYSKQILKVADLHFHKAELTDLVNVRLAMTTILFKFEQCEMCFYLLQQIENDLTHKVLRMCPCEQLFSRLCHDDQAHKDWEKTMGDMPLRKAIKHLFAYCVVFLPSQFPIVPIPLQYEMLRSFGTRPGSRNDSRDFWFDWSVTDAKVYLYLMQYLVCTELQKEAHKQVAMDNIRAIIEEDNERVLRQYDLRQLGHRETAYNLLGWIYMQELRYGDAVQCFIQSWEIRPFHNAVKFHLRDILGKMNSIGLFNRYI